MGIILIDSDAKIKQDINAAAIAQFQSNFNKEGNLGTISSIIQDFVIGAIQRSSAWISLNKGPGNLDAHMGIPHYEISRRLNTLLGIWREEIIITPELIRRPNSFIFRYRFGAIKADFAEVLNSSAAEVPNDSKNARAGLTINIIPWLDWLLTKGNAGIVVGYKIDLAAGKHPFSRSGDAIMVKAEGVNYNVPDEFAGTLDDNFVSRALEELKTNESFRRELIKSFREIFVMTIPTIKVSNSRATVDDFTELDD